MHFGLQRLGKNAFEKAWMCRNWRRAKISVKKFEEFWQETAPVLNCNVPHRSDMRGERGKKKVTRKERDERQRGHGAT